MGKKKEANKCEQNEPSATQPGALEASHVRAKGTWYTMVVDKQERSAQKRAQQRLGYGSALFWRGGSSPVSVVNVLPSNKLHHDLHNKYSGWGEGTAQGGAGIHQSA
jgi:hypothetical protein